MKHIDLFSGIGGFALACQWAGIETSQFVEIDPFCKKVLQKNFPGVPIHDDIKTFHYEGPTPFILTGGFPCQPFSVAGKQRGKEDDRYLWLEMLRVISETRPTWIVGENVVGIIGMGIEQMLSDLEGIQYEIQTLIIPACSLGAEHRRDRLWIIANADFGRFKECGDKRVPSIQPAPMLQWPTEPPICGTINGFPGWVDRLKALGNAIVPQVAYQIIKAIVETEDVFSGKKGGKK